MEYNKWCGYYGCEIDREHYHAGREVCRNSLMRVLEGDEDER